MADGDLREQEFDGHEGDAGELAGDSCDVSSDIPEDTSAERGSGARRAGVRAVTIVGLVSLALFGGLCSLLGYLLYQNRHAADTRDLMLAAARQSAVNLTTIDYKQVEADVQRILDSAAGPFYDDFKNRSGPFIEIINKVQSKSVGTVSEAGVESFGQEEGKILLAVAVKTTNVGVPEERPQYWRMRLTMTKQGDAAKVSEVEFVP